MKLQLQHLGFLLSVVIMGFGTMLQSCKSNTVMSTYVPEETGLNVVKITDESKNTVVGPKIKGFDGYFFLRTKQAGSKKNSMGWSTNQLLSVSPDGSEIAYLTSANKQTNIVVRKSTSASAATQRTFRNVGGFTWGSDDKLYFCDLTEGQFKICSVDAHSGSSIRQITSNNFDYDPILTADGSRLFFTRHDGELGPSIWCYNFETSELTNCARGYNPCTVADSNDEFVCVRNSDDGMSEIWLVNYNNGKETIILSDKEKGFSNPSVSPDGEWIVVSGSAKSNINKKNNLDLYALRIDGSDFTQLTYHPANDTNPRWSEDGQTIYFISDRANKDKAYNIWKINFRP